MIQAKVVRIHQLPIIVNDIEIGVEEMDRVVESF